MRRECRQYVSHDTVIRYCRRPDLQPEPLRPRRRQFFPCGCIGWLRPLPCRLADQKWTQADIGFVLTASTVAGLLSQVPGGELLDKTRSKRTLVAVGAGVVTLSALVIAIRPSFPLVSIGLVLQGVTGGFSGPRLRPSALDWLVIQPWLNG